MEIVGLAFKDAGNVLCYFYKTLKTVSSIFRGKYYGND
jgi:hypothetical protein